MFVFRGRRDGSSLRGKRLGVSDILTEAKLHVCVIDGDSAVRDSLATLLTLMGHEVRTYADGKEFLEALCAAPDSCADCVICEADLPDTSGVDLLQRFRRHRPTARFALLMSRKDAALEAAARASGADAVFQKPLVHGTLKRFVEASRPVAGCGFGNYG